MIGSLIHDFQFYKMLGQKITIDNATDSGAKSKQGSIDFDIAWAHNSEHISNLMVNQQEFNPNCSGSKSALFYWRFASSNCFSNTTTICVILHRRSNQNSTVTLIATVWPPSSPIWLNTRWPLQKWLSMQIGMYFLSSAILLNGCQHDQLYTMYVVIRTTTQQEQYLHSRNN